MDRASLISQKHENEFDIPLTMQQKLKNGNILIIGTSFVNHIEEILHILKKTMSLGNTTLIRSSKLNSLNNGLPSEVVCVEFDSWGSLSMKFNWKKILQLRGQKFNSVIVLYHDQFLKGNRRGELLALLLSTKNIFSYSISGSLTLNSHEMLIRKLLLGIFYGSVSYKWLFFIYLYGLRFYAFFSKTGRRLIRSRW